jgi:hypothetical protein
MRPDMTPASASVVSCGCAAPRSPRPGGTGCQMRRSADTGRRKGDGARLGLGCRYWSFTLDTQAPSSHQHQRRFGDHCDPGIVAPGVVGRFFITWEPRCAPTHSATCSLRRRRCSHRGAAGVIAGAGLVLDDEGRRHGLRALGEDARREVDAGARPYAPPVHCLGRIVLRDRSGGGCHITSAATMRFSRGLLLAGPLGDDVGCDQGHLLTSLGRPLYRASIAALG